MSAVSSPLPWPQNHLHPPTDHIVHPLINTWAKSNSLSNNPLRKIQNQDGNFPEFGIETSTHTWIYIRSQLNFYRSIIVFIKVSGKTSNVDLDWKGFGKNIKRRLRLDTGGIPRSKENLCGLIMISTDQTMES